LRWTSRRSIAHTISRYAAQRLIDDLQREANGEPARHANEGFCPERVVRGSTTPRHHGSPKR
jgi:LacI family transcriptional regulator